LKRIEKETLEVRKGVAPEFARYLEKKFIPPNSGYYKPIPLKKNLALEI
jgi:hypothetical protein